MAAQESKILGRGLWGSFPWPLNKLKVLVRPLVWMALACFVAFASVVFLPSTFSALLPPADGAFQLQIQNAFNVDKPFSLEDLQGQVVLVLMSLAGCPSCPAWAEYLDTLQRDARYKDKPIVFLEISWSPAKHVASKVYERHSSEIKYHHIIVTEGLALLEQLESARVYPKLMLVSKAGKIEYVWYPPAVTEGLIEWALDRELGAISPTHDPFNPRSVGSGIGKAAEVIQDRKSRFPYTQKTLDEVCHDLRLADHISSSDVERLIRFYWFSLPRNRWPQEIVDRYSPIGNTPLPRDNPDLRADSSSELREVLRVVPSTQGHRIDADAKDKALRELEFRVTFRDPDRSVRAGNVRVLEYSYTKEEKAVRKGVIDSVLLPALRQEVDPGDRHDLIRAIYFLQDPQSRTKWDRDYLEISPAGIVTKVDYPPPPEALKKAFRSYRDISTQLEKARHYASRVAKITYPKPLDKLFEKRKAWELNIRDAVIAEDRLPELEAIYNEVLRVEGTVGEEMVARLFLDDVLTIIMSWGKPTPEVLSWIAQTSARLYMEQNEAFDFWYFQAEVLGTLTSAGLEAIRSLEGGGVDVEGLKEKLTHDRDNRLVGSAKLQAEIALKLLEEAFE